MAQDPASEVFEYRHRVIRVRVIQRRSVCTWWYQIDSCTPRHGSERTLDEAATRYRTIDAAMREVDVGCNV